MWTCAKPILFTPGKNNGQDATGQSQDNSGKKIMSHSSTKERYPCSRQQPIQNRGEPDDKGSSTCLETKTCTSQKKRKTHPNEQQEAQLSSLSAERQKGMHGKELLKKVLPGPTQCISNGNNITQMPADHGQPKTTIRHSPPPPHPLYATPPSQCTTIAINSRISILWVKDNAYFPGTVKDIQGDDLYYYIHYDDGEHFAWVDLTQHKFKILYVP